MSLLWQKRKNPILKIKNLNKAKHEDEIPCFFGVDIGGV
jgi:hypothetical protein